MTECNKEEGEKRCVNCRGDHDSRHRGCPTRLKIIRQNRQNIVKKVRRDNEMQRSRISGIGRPLIDHENIVFRSDIERIGQERESPEEGANGRPAAIQYPSNQLRAGVGSLDFRRAANS